jgi:hypothetical protein
MMKIMNSIKLRHANHMFTKFANNSFIKRHLILKNFSNTEDTNKMKQEKEIEYPKILKTLFEKNVKLKKIPCFEVYSSQIEILHQPMDFYLAIIVNIYFFYF